MYDSDWPRSPASTGSCSGILGIVVVVHGWRVLQPFFIGGDLLYHWGLTAHDPSRHVPA